MVTAEQWIATPPPDGPWTISWVTYTFLRAELERLRDEVYRLTVDRDHWYRKATYKPEELHRMYEQASLGLDENGRWLWPDGERTAA